MRRNWMIQEKVVKRTRSKMGDGMQEHVLLTYYVKYLKEIRMLSDSSINHYTQAMRRISSYLIEKKKVQETIYEIYDIGQLEVIKEFLYSDPEFVDLDDRGHRMYSAGLNNYFRFAYGEGFESAKEKIIALDVEAPIREMDYRIVASRSRYSIIKIQAIESAGYKCEYDTSHETFISKSTGHPYMEGHHALPMKYQEKFNHSLDVYANIICLCPICHRLLHYGLDEQKKKYIDKIYHERSDRLAKSGLRISKDDFCRLVI